MKASDLTARVGRYRPSAFTSVWCIPLWLALEDGDIEVGISPESEEVLLPLACFCGFDQPNAQRTSLLSSDCQFTRTVIGALARPTGAASSSRFPSGAISNASGLFAGVSGS